MPTKSQRTSVGECRKHEAKPRLADQKEQIDDLKDAIRANRENLEHYQQRTAEDRERERAAFEETKLQLQGQLQQTRLLQLCRILGFASGC